MENKNKNLPTHIAIIPDGNRRWAREHKLDVWLGHREGIKSLDELADIIVELGIPHLSFWGSSEDNLKKRPAEEVKFLLGIFKKKFSELSENEKIHKNKIKINIFGKWREQFPEDIKEPMERAIEATKNYHNFFLNFFIAYSGTGEMINAVKSIAEKVKDSPKFEINKELLKSCLLTCDLPSVDLVIRTGGEPHLSDGFMMWETADAQLYFSDKLWPDFTPADFRAAIEDYGERGRRYGE